jgi:hypothetical protein
MAAAPKALAALAALLLSDLVMADALRLVGVDRRQVGLEEDEVEFLVTVHFVNDSGQPDDSPYVVATVPSDGRLVEGSATGPGAVISQSAPPMAYPDGSSREAFEENPPDRVQSLDPADRESEGGSVRIRWDLPGPMDPGVTGIVSFRIRAPSRASGRSAEAGREGPPGATERGQSPGK